MYPLHDNDLDRLSRNAAEHYEMDFGSSGWEQLEKRLDEELPRRGDRKRFLFWLFFIVVTTGGALIGLLINSQTVKPLMAMAAPVARVDGAASATRVADAEQVANERRTNSGDRMVSTDERVKSNDQVRTRNTDDVTSTNNHITSANDHITSANDHITSANDHTTNTDDHTTNTNKHTTNTNDHVKSPAGRVTGTADRVSGTDNSLTAGSKPGTGTGEGITSIGERITGNGERMTGAGKGTTSTGERMTSNKNGEVATRTNGNRTNTLKYNNRKKKPNYQTDNLNAATKLHTRKNNKAQNTISDNSVPDNAIPDNPVPDNSYKQLNDNPIVDNKTTAADSTTSTAQPKPAQPDSTAAVAPQPTHHYNQLLEFGLVAGPDASMVEFGPLHKAGYNLGIQIGLRINNRLSFNTGVIYTKKFYQADSTTFHAPKRSPASYVDIDKLIGNCAMFDIPFNVRYDFTYNDKRRLFGSAGVSTYIMDQQWYKMWFRDRGSRDRKEYSHDIYKNEDYFVSVLNFSVGYERSLSKRFSVQAEPYLKVPLTGMGYGTMKIGSYGMFFSLKYKPTFKTTAKQKK